MLFIVPDTDVSPPADTKPAGDDTTNSVVNVELDLDDAPFLDEPKSEPVPEAPKTADAPVSMPEAEEKKSSRKEKILGLLKNKKVLIAVAASLILFVGGGIAAKIFLFSASPPEEKAPVVAEEKPIEPRKIVVSTAAPEAQGPKAPAFLVAWEPFWVPLKGLEGEILFLVCEFSIPTDDPNVNAEIEAKVITLRDAVYYYLSHKPFATLLDKNNAQSMRTEIVNVLNENLTAGKVEQIYLKEYYTTGT